MKLDWLDYFLITLIGIYLLASPYTKVEESFNIQAVHDILIHGTDISKYDHLEFPGVVPRTFIGALILSGLVKPVQRYMTFDSKFDLQLIGVLNTLGLINFRKTAEWVLDSNGQGAAISNFFVLFQYCQFHVIYYASRTLPNMFAFPLTNYAFSYVLSGDYHLALSIISFTAVVFRIELALMAGCLAASLLIFRRCTIVNCVKFLLLGSVIGGTLSLAVDSVFWQQRFYLPELNAFMFNVVQGQSSSWGEEPYYTYFISHIPNLIANPAALVLVFPGIIAGRLFTSKKQDSKDGSKADENQLDLNVGFSNLRICALTCFLYISIYSLQPHKEWRFIIYCVPIISLAAASGASLIWEKRYESFVYKIAILLIVLSSFTTLVVSVAKVATSSLNYPGGQALSLFHNLVEISTPPPMVHMDIPTCMSGATLFGQLYDDPSKTPYIIYDKTEDPDSLDDIWSSFDYLITASDLIQVSAGIEKGYEWVNLATIDAFAGINVSAAEELVQASTQDPKSFATDLITSLLDGDAQFAINWWNKAILMEPSVYIYHKVPVQPQAHDSLNVPDQETLKTANKDSPMEHWIEGPGDIM